MTPDQHLKRISVILNALKIAAKQSPSQQSAAWAQLVRFGPEELTWAHRTILQLVEENRALINAAKAIHMPTELIPEDPNELEATSSVIIDERMLEEVSAIQFLDGLKNGEYSIVKNPRTKK